VAGCFVAAVAAGALPASGQIVAQTPVETGIFGLAARGHRFVYVFDRSASMAEPAGQPLARAKAELLRSLDQLGDVQQFYIIFYNERMHLFTPAVAGRLVFATDDNRRAARRFVESVRASGGTRHAEPLAAALRLAPDVIFMLTDGDGPDDLTEQEHARLADSLGRTRCLIVQFGGAGGVRSPRLARLAAQSGGDYKVVDAAVE
jgi:Mg-chelatase subunit ChlD